MILSNSLKNSAHGSQALSIPSLNAFHCFFVAGLWYTKDEQKQERRQKEKQLSGIPTTSKKTKIKRIQALASDKTNSTKVQQKRA